MSGMILACVLSFAPVGGTAKGEYADFEVGRMIPDLTLQDMEGEAVRLRDFVGKKVLICTWASW